MALDRTTLFAYLRRAPFGGRLSTAQVAGVAAILDACRSYGVVDLRWIAYILATAFHETGGTMQPVRETFATSDAQAIARLDAAWAKGKLPQVSKPYWRAGWFGRGYVQLTHLANYARMGAALGLELVKTPSLMLKAGPAAKAIVIGMRDGMFTKKRLAEYFAVTANPVAARSIVNGRDKAKLIATHYEAFHAALQAADEATPQPADVTPAAAEADDVPPAHSKSLWATLTAFLGGTTSLPFLGNVGNGYALGALALILLAGGIAAWLVLSGRITINRSKAP